MKPKSKENISLTELISDFVQKFGDHKPELSKEDQSLLIKRIFSDEIEQTEQKPLESENEIEQEVTDKAEETKLGHILKNFVTSVTGTTNNTALLEKVRKKMLSKIMENSVLKLLNVETTREIVNKVDFKELNIFTKTEKQLMARKRRSLVNSDCGHFDRSHYAKVSL